MSRALEENTQLRSAASASKSVRTEEDARLRAGIEAATRGVPGEDANRPPGAASMMEQAMSEAGPTADEMRDYIETATKSRYDPVAASARLSRMFKKVESKQDMPRFGDGVKYT